VKKVLNKVLLEEELKNGMYKLSFICKKLGLTRAGFDKKRKGKIPFRVTEICTLAELYNWNADKVWKIFFNKKF